jgi:NitT/TauT family transport system substrate-binding protein
MKKKLVSVMATVAVAGLALTGCGSGSPSGGSGESSSGASATGGSTGTGATGGDSGELTQVTVGVLPIAPSVGVQYGIEEGIFEKHGFDVELSTQNAGAAMLPAVANQQLTFGVGNPLSVMTAVDQGLDMRIAAGYSNSLAEGEDIAGVVTRADSGIETFADLEGKTTAINALKTQGDLTIMEATEKAGGDPSALKFSEMPFPDMPAQLERGNADAIWVPEPFLTSSLEDENNKLVGYSFQEAIPGMPTMVTFTSGAYAEQNPEEVKEFAAAMSEALDAAQQNPDATRALLPEFINLPEEVAQSLKMEELSGEIRTDEINQIGELAVKFDFINGAPDPAKLYIQ